MSQYRLSIYFDLQIGVGVRANKEFITIGIPLFTIKIGLLKEAHGAYILGKEFESLISRNTLKREYEKNKHTI